MSTQIEVTEQVATQLPMSLFEPLDAPCIYCEEREGEGHIETRDEGTGYYDREWICGECHSGITSPRFEVVSTGVTEDVEF